MTHSPTPTERLALRTANAALISSPDAFCDIASTIVFALGSAQLLQSPETATERELLSRELATARAELAEYEPLNPQQCLKGKHADWLVNSEYAHACPWCEIELLRGRVAELEALKPAPIQTCRTCGAGYTYGQPCSSCQFRARMDAELALQRIEAEHPEADTTHRCGIPLTRRLDCGHCPHEVCETCDRCPHSCRCAAPQQPVEDPHESPLHHDYAEPRDLPARADLPESLR